MVHYHGGCWHQKTIHHRLGFASASILEFRRVHVCLDYCLVGSVNRQRDSRLYFPLIPTYGGNVPALVSTRDSILAAA